MPKISELLSEAIYGGPVASPVDVDDSQYRRLSQARRDLPVVEQSRMIEWAAWLYGHNPLARRLIDIQTQYVLGEGIKITADEDAIESLLNLHWLNQVNNWPIKGEQRFNDLRLFGEACYPVAVTPGKGIVILGVVDPSRIKSVVRDMDQIDEADHVILNAATSGGAEQRFKVIRENIQTNRLEGAEADPSGSWDGSCFYFAINKIATASRGISDLFALIDYIDGADQFLWAQLERAKLQNAQIWDVSVDGSPNDVQQEEARIIRKQPTKPGTINVHTKSVTWSAISPDLKSDDNDVLSKSILRWVTGGVGMPEAWFGNGADTKGGTLEGQTDPSIKRMTSIQNNWKSNINFILRYQYEQAQAKGTPGLKELEPGKPMPWRIEAPDMQVKDLARLGAMINQLVTALAEAEALQYVSKDTGRRTFLALLGQVGTISDPKLEAEAIAKQPPPDYLNPNGGAGMLPPGMGGDDINGQKGGGAGPTPAEKAAGGQNAYMNSRATEALLAAISQLTEEKPQDINQMEADETTVVAKNTKRKKKSGASDEGLPEQLEDEQLTAVETTNTDTNDSLPPEDDDESKTKKKARRLKEALVVFRGVPEEVVLTEGQEYEVLPALAARTVGEVDAFRVLKITLPEGTTVRDEAEGIRIPRGKIYLRDQEEADFVEAI